MADPSTGLEKLIDQHEKAVDMAQASITSAVQALLQVVEQQQIELLQSQQRIDRLEQELEEARQDNRDSDQGEGADHAALLLEMNRLRARCNEETMSEQQFRELVKTCAGDGGPPRKEVIPEILVGMKQKKVAQLRSSLRLSSATPLSIGSYEPNLELPGILKEQVARAKSMKIAPTEEQLLPGSGPPSYSIDVCSEPIECKEEENEDECAKADPRVDSTTPEEDVAPAPLLQPPTADGPQARLQPNRSRVRPLSSHRLIAAVPERSALSAEVVGQLQELKEREKALDEETRVQRAAAAALIASHSHRIALRLRFNRAVASIHDTPEASAGRLRNEVIREFVNSEASYSYFLEMVVTNFLIPLLERRNNSIPSKGRDKPPSLSLRYIRAVFCNIEVIFSLSASFLMDLRSRLAKWPTEPFKIGELLRELLVQFGPVYEKYIINYPTAVQVLEKLEAKKQFKQWMEFKAEKPIFAKFSLISFLVMPIQRLPRYILLLTELLRFTPEVHIERDPLLDCLAYATQVGLHECAPFFQVLTSVKLVKKLDSAKGTAELAAAVVELQHKMAGAPELAVGGRILLKSGPVSLQTPEKPAHKKRHLFLFNDLLLWTSGNPASPMRYQGSFSLTGCSLEFLEDTAEQQNAFNIRAPVSASLEEERDIHVGGDVYHVQCASSDERDTWMKDISRAIAVLVTLKDQSYPHVRNRKWNPKTVSWQVTSVHSGQLHEPSMIGAARMKRVKMELRLSSASGENDVCPVSFSQPTTPKEADLRTAGEKELSAPAGEEKLSAEKGTAAADSKKEAPEIPVEEGNGQDRRLSATAEGHVDTSEITEAQDAEASVVTEEPGLDPHAGLASGGVSDTNDKRAGDGTAGQGEGCLPHEAVEEERAQENGGSAEEAGDVECATEDGEDFFPMPGPDTLHTSVDEIAYDQVISLADENIEDLLLPSDHPDMSAAEECIYIQELMSLMQGGEDAWVKRMSLAEIENLVRLHSEEPDPYLDRLKAESLRSTVYAPISPIGDAGPELHACIKEAAAHTGATGDNSAPLGEGSPGAAVGKESAPDSRREGIEEGKEHLVEEAGEEKVANGAEDSPRGGDITVPTVKCDADDDSEDEEDTVVIIGEREVHMSASDREKLLREAQRASVVLAPKRFGGSWRGRVSIIGTRQSAAAAFEPTQPSVVATDDSIAAARAYEPRMAAPPRAFITRTPSLPTTGEKSLSSSASEERSDSEVGVSLEEDSTDEQTQLLEEELRTLEEHVDSEEKRHSQR